MTSAHVRHKDDQNIWNFIFTLIFLGLAVASAVHMQRIAGGLPQGITVFDAILIALATFRLTRLMVYDKIMRWFRELFMKRKVMPATDTMPAYVELDPYGSGPLRTIYELLRCPWCIGVWAGLVVTYCYFMYLWAWYAIFILAVAGAGSFIQLVTNGIGWRAELKKLEVLEKEKNMDSTC